MNRNGKDAVLVIDDGVDSAEDLSELLRERARILSEVPPQQEAGERIAALSFQIDDEIYCIELKYLLEMRQSTPLRRLPGVLPHLAGVMNLRGELLPVVDLRPVLGLGKSETSGAAPATLVLSFKGDKLAVAVDRARDILSFPANELKLPPMSLDPERAPFVRGEYLLEGRLMTLLDAEKILTDPRFAGETREA
jgi:purine-binding chemotaxis protein CheW